MENQIAEHDDENQYTQLAFCQRAAGGCKAVKTLVWNSFRSGFPEHNTVGKDG